MTKVRTIVVQKDILGKNDEIAQRNRDLFTRKKVAVVNLLSSPGAGKTTLLCHTITERQKNRRKVAVIEGDQQTDHDARQIAETGAAVVQLNTIGACHLDASMVEKGLADLDLEGCDTLFIENVGNLVCPASYDLGEGAKVVLLSVTEGEDKPAKYPKMFRVADLMVITKIDLLPYVDFDVARCIDWARRVNPNIKAITLSVKSGEGLDAWRTYLDEKEGS